MTATSPTATSATDAGAPAGAGTGRGATARQETGFMNDNKNTRGIRRTVTVMAVIALLIYLGFMLQTAMTR